MSDISCVAEGRVKYRDGKKWKPRWCVLKKPSPVADRLHVLLYKDLKDVNRKIHPKSNFFLEGFYGLETGFSYDKESNVLAIICQKQVTLFSFDDRKVLIQFEIKIRKSLGEEDQFPVQVTNVPAHSKLPLDCVCMHIHGQKFCLTSNIPPKVLISWQISELRRFGVVDRKFIFEGGSTCGKGAGVHALSSEQVETINEIINLSSQGKTASCKKSNKRRSQAFDFTDPLSNTFNDNFYKDFKNRQTCADQNFMDDKKSKRFSLSLTDFTRTQAYDRYLKSKDDLERERRKYLMYDVPPSRIRKVETSNLYLNTKDLASVSQQASQGGNYYVSNSKSQIFLCDNVNMDNNQRTKHWVESDSCMSSASVPSSDSRMSISSEEHSTSPVCLGQMVAASASAPTLCGYGTYQSSAEVNKFISGSVPSRIDEESEQSRRSELEILQKSEQDLQREILLLDEMIMGVRESSQRKDNNYLKEKPPPLPKKKCRSPRRPNNVSLSPRSERYSTISSQGSVSGYSDSVLLSPNLVNKLRKIPSRSKLSAPLPYVNLEKYDVGDVDNSHVYIAGTEDDNCSILSGRSGSYDNVRNRELKASKENISAKAKQGYKEQRSESQRIHVDIPESNYMNTECIYANDIPARENSPPTLPPKGPELLRKSRPLQPPPIPPGKHRMNLVKRNTYSSQYSSPRHGINPVRESIREPCYLVMAGVESSPTSHRRSEAPFGTSQNGNTHWPDYTKGERLKVKLPKRSPSLSNKENCNPSDQCGYMDMTGMFEDEQIQMKSSDDKDVSEESPQKRYTRSSSASSIPEQKPQRPIFQHSLSMSESPKTPIREENYLLMSHLPSPKKSVLENLQSLKSYVSAKSANRTSVMDEHKNQMSPMLSHKEYEKAKHDDLIHEKSKELVKGKSSLPFPNLINFQKHSIQKSSSVGIAASASTNSVQSVSSEKNSSENSGRSPGFLTRLIRRNSGNRKSMSQSQENLLASSSSESCLDKSQLQAHVNRETASVKDVSNSSESSTGSSNRCQIHNEFGERRRSSSFPNRSSFLEMNSNTNKDHSSQTSQDSFYSNGTIDDQKQLIGPDNNSHSCGSDSKDADSSKSQSGYTGPCDCQTEADDAVSKKSEGNCLSPKTFQKFRKTQEMGIFTVLRVDEPSYKFENCQNSSKTDDEKLIDLMKYSKVKEYYSDTDSEKSDSLKSDLKSSLTVLSKKCLSPSEEAAAIAKHVSSLPPFVPPKQKSFPCALSPVLENAPFERKDSSKEQSNVDCLSTSSHKSGLNNRSVTQKELSDALSKVVKPIATEEEEEQSVWIKREKENTSIANSVIADQESKFAALVVEVEQEGNSDDAISLSSYESSIASEDAVRSSPASTILRPRSGKEYKVVERKRPLNESLNSSPSPTHHSPSLTSSVFTFDQVSQFSTLSKERESPNLPKFSRSESIHSRFSERAGSYKVSYMNIDMTPPSSPSYSQSLSIPPEQGERQLNYAEIDLSLPLKSSRKMRKSSQKSLKIQKSSSIDYAMIDMEATVAIQRAGQEHKMSRVDSLKRSDQKLSLSIKEEVADSSDMPETSLTNKKETEEQESCEANTFLTTHKYVNVPPPKDEDVQTDQKTEDEGTEQKEEESTKQRKEEDDAVFLPEKILLPIRENQDTSSSEDEDGDSDSSDSEVIIIE